jgi:2-alkenal reductase
MVFFTLCGILVWGTVLIFSSTSPAQPSAQLESPPSRMEVVRPTPMPVQPILIPADVEDVETALLRSIYAAVNPSVVNLSVLSFRSNIPQQQLFPFPSPESGESGPSPESLIPQGQGSGFVWDQEGHIVTNAHVVEGADQVQVSFWDGTVSVAEVVGVDGHSDLAVIKIDPAGYDLRPVARGNLDEVGVGDRVVTIGNPFGYAGTMTSGIVSAIGRSIPALTTFSIPEAIQTDAVINPGNSGGPMLNRLGEVIGVNAQIRVSNMSNTGIGFAIPVTIVERVIPKLISDGSYQHAYIGISGNTFSPICAEALNLSPELRGAYVVSVLNGTPAARAGLRGGNQPTNSNLVGVCPDRQGGDLITAINGEPVRQFDDILIYLTRYTSPGDEITLTILRNGNVRDLTVRLAPRPE